MHEQAPNEDASWELVLFCYATDTTDVTQITRVRLRTDSTEVAPSRIVSRSRVMQEVLVEVKRLMLTRDQFERIASAPSPRRASDTEPADTSSAQNSSD